MGIPLSCILKQKQKNVTPKLKDDIQARSGRPQSVRLQGVGGVDWFADYGASPKPTRDACLCYP